LQFVIAIWQADIRPYYARPHSVGSELRRARGGLDMEEFMKCLSIAALGALLATTAAFGCPVTFINDTGNTVFAFDENHNEGNMLAPGTQHIYGNEGRHPVVTFYTLMPESNSYKKSCRIIQRACALYAIDKIVSLAAAMKGEINKGVFEVIDFALNPEVPPCCMHEGEGNEMAVDEPISTMDEE